MRSSLRSSLPITGRSDRESSIYNLDPAVRATLIKESDLIDLSLFNTGKLVEITTYQIQAKLPTLALIEEISRAIKLASDQALNSRSTTGTNYSKVDKLNFNSLLSSLERAEKFLDLIAGAKPSSNLHTNRSRGVALKCSAIIRSLRKELICNKPDPAHPNQSEAGALVTLLDRANFKLNTKRIKLEESYMSAPSETKS